MHAMYAVFHTNRFLCASYGSAVTCCASRASVVGAAGAAGASGEACCGANAEGTAAAAVDSDSAGSRTDSGAWTVGWPVA